MIRQSVDGPHSVHSSVHLQTSGGLGFLAVEKTPRASSHLCSPSASGTGFLSVAGCVAEGGRPAACELKVSSSGLQ